MGDFVCLSQKQGKIQHFRDDFARGADKCAESGVQ